MLSRITPISEETTNDWEIFAWGHDRTFLLWKYSRIRMQCCVKEYLKIWAKKPLAKKSRSSALFRWWQQCLVVLYPSAELASSRSIKSYIQFKPIHLQQKADSYKLALTFRGNNKFFLFSQLLSWLLCLTAARLPRLCKGFPWKYIGVSC